MAYIECRNIRDGSVLESQLSSTGFAVTMMSVLWPVFIPIIAILLPIVFLIDWFEHRIDTQIFSKLGERTFGRLFSKLVMHCVVSHEKK